MRCVIDIKNGVARHADYRLKEPVSLQLMQGECVAIVGRNGSGKTMLAEMLTGEHPLLPGGSISYDFGPNASPMVYENLRVVRFRDSYGTDDGRYYHQLRWNQHEDPDPLMLLSSGELRRYFIRKAMNGRPHVLFVDNPFIGLDAGARSLLAAELLRLKDEGVLLVLIMSKTDDMPDCVTHVVEVHEGVVCPILAVDRWKPEPVPSHVLADRLPKKELGQRTDVGTADMIIDLHDVSIRYGTRTILEGLNWQVRRGERWALSGRNGSGKSTLLSIVCADNPQAYANDVTLFGHRRGSGESIWDIKRHIGYVSPEMHRAFKRDVPVIEAVASGMYDTAGMYGRVDDRQLETCMKWMEVFGIAHYRDTSMMRLSSGEQRLVLLARAFVKSPQLLILDEPLHGLDAWNRRLVKDVIEAYCEDRDKTLVMVTHYEEDLPSCIDHRLELKSVPTPIE